MGVSATVTHAVYSVYVPDLYRRCNLCVCARPLEAVYSVCVPDQYRLCTLCMCHSYTGCELYVCHTYTGCVLCVCVIPIQAVYSVCVSYLYRLCILCKTYSGWVLCVICVCRLCALHSFTYISNYELLERYCLKCAYSTMRAVCFLCHIWRSGALL